MGRPRKFTPDQIAAMKERLQEYCRPINETGRRMSITDTRMSNILEQEGYAVDAKYVERLRNEMSILPREHLKKFSDHELSAIQEILESRVVPDIGKKRKLLISDAKMTELLNKRGYSVNATYVERMRHALNINAFQKRNKPSLIAE